MPIDESLLSATDAQKQKIRTLIRDIRQGPEITVFQNDCTGEIYIPVEDGEIRCLHHKPDSPVGIRPVVFLPGWGTHPDGFGDFFNAVNGRIECFYLETREKNSSRLDRSHASLSMEQHARDIQAALLHFGLAEDRDFVLMGTCWGATMIASALALGIVRAPTVVLLDPMHALWFPKWILNYIAPLTPDWFWDLIRPIAKRIALCGMREETQRKRLESFIDNGTVWKWRRAALQAKDFELYDTAHEIQQEVCIVNGVRDHVHDNTHYPRLAARMPKGRFFYLEADESRREHLMGLTAVEFARLPESESPPPVFREFEKEIHQQEL